MSDDPIKKEEKSGDVVAKFDVTQSFIDTFKCDGRVSDIIKNHFVKLPRKFSPYIFVNVFTSKPINFTDYVDTNHYCFKVMKKKMDEKYQLIRREYMLLKKDLTLLLNEISKGFIDADETERKDYIKIEGINCLVINKTHTKDELFKWFCDEDGDVCFKYDFSNCDLPLSSPITNNNLQRVRIQITSFPIVFGLVIQNKYTCPDKTSILPDEICSSPHIMAKHAYELESVRDKLICPGFKHSTDTQGRIKRSKCNNALYPVQKLSRFVDCYFYDINFEDEDGMVQTSSSFSFNKLMPGFYEAVIYSYTSNLRPTNYQIVDFKPIDDVNMYIPYKEEGKNYILTLQENLDKFIQQQTGQMIHGLIPIKLALILQKLASTLDYPLKFNLDFSGEKSCGKSMLMKYYGLLLYDYNFLSTNGLSVSIPALRGTTDKVFVMNKEMNINRIGFLGTYKCIHIDEVGENRDLVQHLKIFLMESNYSNNMARADSATRKRTAHINITKNLDQEHLGQYRGGIKKMYDAYDQKDEIQKEIWDNTWDLFQPLNNYEDNPYLKSCIKKQRDKLTSEQKYWLDGLDLALHDRFPFYFYVEDDDNKNLKEVLKENATTRKIEETTQLIKCIKNNDIDKNFKKIKEFDVDVSKEIFSKVNKLVDAYGIQVDSRILDVYYMVIKLSSILNKRKIPDQEDFDLLAYFLETTNRKVTTSEIEKYEIKGPQAKVEKETDDISVADDKFGITDSADEEVMEDFK